MSRRRRLTQIVTAVVSSGGLDVASLARRFDVSPATVRRDLEVLESQRLLTRTHGGARVHPDFKDIPLGYKSADHSPEKRRIAEYALTYLDGARVIGLNGGTTMSEFARGLLGRQGLAVITSALNIAADLAGNPTLRVFSAGGEVRPSSQEVVGRSAEAFVSGYNLDVVFLGVDGVDAEGGCTAYDPAGAAVSLALAARARKVVVLADASKLGRVALAPVRDLSEVDVLVTDSRAPAPSLAAIEAVGCTVVVV